MESAGLGKRHLLVFMCFVAAFVCYIDRVNISVAIIPMAEHFGWTATQKGFVLSSFFIGYMLGQIPAGAMANRIGGKWALAGALALWSLFTALTPAAGMAGFAALIGTRIVLGAGESMTFPAAYNLFSKWIPRTERSRAIAATLGGIPLGTVMGLALSGVLVSQFGWPSVFYVFGSAGVVLALVWVVVIHDSPSRHPALSEAEKLHIAANVDVHGVARAPLPIGKLLSAPPFWALLINHFCSNWTLYVLLSWLPSYFRDVQHLAISKAGLAAAAPWLTMFVMSNASAWIADKLIQRGADASLVRKIMQCTALIGSAVFMLIASQSTTTGGAVVLLCGALGLLGLTWAGYAPNHLEIAPRHADILMGVTNTAGTLPGVIGVALTGWVLDTTGSYVSVFVLAAGVSAVGALVWIIFSRSKPII